MNYPKTFITIIGVAMLIFGLGGVPIYAIQGDILRFGVYTCLLVAGIIILGHAAKD